MRELQFVISISGHPEAEAFAASDPRVAHACIVKVGTEVVGEVWSDAKGRWRWRVGDTESEPFGRRLEAVWDLLEGLDLDDQERDVLEYESNGTRVVLHGSKFLCTGCGEWVQGSETGLRRIRGDLIRSQAQCKRCRSRKSV